MPSSNAKVADLLRRYAGVLLLEQADKFKVRAYQRAAETIESLDVDVAKLVAGGGDLKQFPNIGPAISRTIEDIIRTGQFSRLEQSSSRLQPELIELSKWPALDPRRVQRVYKKLNIHSIDELRRHLDVGTIREIFGARTEYHLRQGLDDRPRMLLYSAERLAKKIQEFLRSIPGVTRVSAVGSLRRKKDTVGDLNFLVTGTTAATVFKRFAAFGGVQSFTQRTKNEKVFRFSSGLTVGLAWTAESRWAISLIKHTGSIEHLNELQARSELHGTDFSKKFFSGRAIRAVDEAAVYRQLGLTYIEPELREGRGEVAAAANGKLPSLVQKEDLKGDLHMHTVASDGANSITEMVAVARERGYEYIAITDHSQSLKITNGLSEKRLLSQIREIDELNARLTGFVILKSAEVDILEDGKLDYSNAVLKELDLTMCSIHSRFGLNREQQTTRILRAMDNPYFNILGHATGRLLLKREGYDLDMERILAHAKDVGCFVEINSSPDRLDLSDVHAKLAKDQGLLVAVNTDAHSIGELDFISAGINQARRAWLEKGDILNARSLPKLKRLLQR